MIKIDRFSEQMKIELKNNSHKPPIVEFQDFNKIIVELEYHKSKIFMAIRDENRNAIKEYIADTANMLFALGNSFGLYDEETEQSDFAHELNKGNLIKRVDVKNQSKNQKLI